MSLPVIGRAATLEVIVCVTCGSGVDCRVIDDTGVAVVGVIGWTTGNEARIVLDGGTSDATTDDSESASEDGVGEDRAGVSDRARDSGANTG